MTGHRNPKMLFSIKIMLSILTLTNAGKPTLWIDGDNKFTGKNVKVSYSETYKGRRVIFEHESGCWLWPNSTRAYLLKTLSMVRNPIVGATQCGTVTLEFKHNNYTTLRLKYNKKDKGAKNTVEFFESKVCEANGTQHAQSEVDFVEDLKRKWAANPELANANVAVIQRKSPNSPLCFKCKKDSAPVKYRLRNKPDGQDYGCLQCAKELFEDSMTKNNKAFEAISNMKVEEQVKAGYIKEQRQAIYHAIFEACYSASRRNLVVSWI